MLFPLHFVEKLVGGEGVEGTENKNLSLEQMPALLFASTTQVVEVVQHTGEFGARLTSRTLQILQRWREQKDLPQGDLQHSQQHADTTVISRLLRFSLYLHLSPSFESK